jgi:hypothetical protein
MFVDDQTERYSKKNPRGISVEPEFADFHASICEREQWHDSERHPPVKSILKSLDRRHGFATGDMQRIQMRQEFPAISDPLLSNRTDAGFRLIKKSIRPIFGSNRRHETHEHAG